MRLSRNLLAIAPLVLATAAALAQAPASNFGAQKILDDSNGQAIISLDKATGNARFIRLPQQSLGSLATVAPDSDPAAQAKAFFRNYGSAFGATDADTELEAVRTVRSGSGAEHVVFKQTHENLPVFGGELRAHFNRNGELFAANGLFVSHLKLNTTPQLSAEQAGGIAIRAIIRQQAMKHRASLALDSASDVFNENDYADLRAVSTTLMVFRAGLLQGVPGADHLAYEVEVRNDAVTIREFVYIDAHKGSVVDQITGIYDALDRRAYDSEGDPAPGPNYPGSPFWVEGQVPFPTGTLEADNMINGSEETYDLFDNAFGRDSFDGLGATMDSIFNRGDSCPNASWNGTFISFCPGTTSDDVVGHEWGHAYTQYTNNLIYQWQSGALNESYSDIWGEIVDLINGRQTDAPGGARSDGSCSDFGPGGPGDASYRWLMGEDATAFGVAIRDMWNPNCAGDPGSVSDPVYWCSTGDSGGVHINSGIPNHAFALMVDGGTFNGYSDAGIGLTKAAHIHFAAQNLLTNSSNFADHADALDAACANLTGDDLNDLSTGLASGMMISAADCAQVAAISDAVEFRTPPTQCEFEPLLDPDAPDLCPVGAINSVLDEDFEGGALPAGWAASSHDVANPATFDSPGWSVTGGLPSGAAGSFAAFAPDLVTGDCALDTEAGVIALDSPPIVLPVGEVPHVAFDHWVATEAGWDGGNLKVSVNGGPWTVLPATAYSFNPYNASLNASDNPLGGEEAFTGTNGGEVSGSWGQSQVELLHVAAPGDTVRFRLDFGTDGCNGLFGWYVDEFHAYSCPSEAFPVCGDGVLGAGQQCDDGNTSNGDGCSSSCQIEEGWSCTDPVPESPGGTNVVADWSFEGGVPNADWTPFSTFGGIAGFPLCGPGNGCPAVPTNTGAWVVWIGGLGPPGVTSSVEQSVTIPAAATDLTLWVLRGICDVPTDTLDVSLDGTSIGTVDCGTTDGGYVEHTFPVAPFNDGGAHTLLIGGTTGAVNTNTNFFVDDVVINDNTPSPPIPSECTQVIEDLACNAGTVGFDLGIASSWTVVDNAGTGVVWTDIASSGIGGNYTGGVGDAASANSDAFAFTEYDSELRSNSFSLAGQANASLDYLVNYQDLDPGFDVLDVGVSTDGGTNWTTLLSWDEDHPPGGLFAAPGEAVSIDLSDYLGEPDVQVRWHYYDPETSDWDWYAQVDNVALECGHACDMDQDGDIERDDYRALLNARGQAVAPGAPGDPDLDGVVTRRDLSYCGRRL